MFAFIQMPDAHAKANNKNCDLMFLLPLQFRAFMSKIALLHANQSWIHCHMTKQCNDVSDQSKADEEHCLLQSLALV